MISLCTYFDKNYLYKGLALHASLVKHHGTDFDLFVLALDDETFEAVEWLPRVWATRLAFLEDEYTPTRELKAIKQTRSLLEYYWTLTPFFTAFSLQMSHTGDIAYIDADCFLFHPLDSLYREVRKANIAIIPHRFSPEQERTHGINGTYNVGWVYFKQHATAQACLAEWTAQCAEWCYQKSERGPNGKVRFGDQAYLNDWTSRYNSHVVQHLGANLAPWNQANYEYEIGAGARKDEAKKMYVIERGDGGGVKRIDPLLFYHFHAHTFTSVRSAGVFGRGGYPLHKDVVKHVYEPYESCLRAIQRDWRPGKRETQSLAFV